MARDVRYFDESIESGRPSDVCSRLKRRVAQYCREDSETQRALIGKASGNNAIEAMKCYGISSEFNVRIALYETDNERDWRDVKEDMVLHFKSQDHPAFSDVTDSESVSGGRHSSAPRHFVFLALKTPPVYYWDYLQPNLESCKEYVERYAAKTRVELFYIGIASGEDEVSAMKGRYDKFKKDEGINEAIAIYRARTQPPCRKMEKDLIDHFKCHTKIWNRRRGGGGRDSEQLNYYVYLALRITPEGQ